MPDCELQSLRDPGLLDFMEYVRIILNDGRYQLRTIGGIPTWTGIEGEMVLYSAGNERGMFYYINGQWNVSYFANSTGQSLIQLGSGDNVIYGDVSSGFWIGNAVFASAPFRVNMAGVLTATSATITGAITASSGSIGGFTIGASSLTAGTGASAVGLAPGTYPFYAGSVTAASAPFRVAASGAIVCTTTITIGSGETYITIDGNNEYIRTSDYVSGALGSGWHIGLDVAEFNNIRARGKITTACFEKDVISSIGGNLLVSDSDILNADM